MLKALTAHHVLSPDILAAAKSLRDCASTALDTKAYMEHTSIILEDDPV